MIDQNVAELRKLFHVDRRGYVLDDGAQKFAGRTQLFFSLFLRRDVDHRHKARVFALVLEILSVDCDIDLSAVRLEVPPGPPLRKFAGSLF